MITPQQGGAIYAQLAGILRRQILDGQLRPGDRLPSETYLQQQYGLSRQTVRKAVTVLRAEGLVALERGRGVVVREHVEVQDLTPPPGSTVVARMPTAEERAGLEIDEGVPVLAVSDAHGGEDIYPADRWRLRWPS